MALRFKINAEQYAQLNEAVRNEYRKEGESYVLDTIGDHPQVATLNTQLMNQASERMSLESKLTDANARLQDAENKANEKSKESIEKLTKERDSLRDQVVTSAVDSEVKKIASQFKQPELFDATLRGRIKGELDADGKVVVKYYDAKGAETDATKLADEYVKNPNYVTMLNRAQNTPTVTTPSLNNPSSPATPATPTGGTYVDPNTQQLRADMGKATDAELASGYDAIFKQQDANGGN